VHSVSLREFLDPRLSLHQTTPQTRVRMQCISLITCRCFAPATFAAIATTLTYSVSQGPRACRRRNARRPSCVENVTRAQPYRAPGAKARDRKRASGAYAKPWAPCNEWSATGKAAHELNCECSQCTWPAAATLFRRSATRPVCRGRCNPTACTARVSRHRAQSWACTNCSAAQSTRPPRRMPRCSNFQNTIGIGLLHCMHNVKIKRKFCRPSITINRLL
jgi:hypothetical protein